MKQKPLIEKYLTYLRISEEQAIARIRQEAGMHPLENDMNMIIATSYGRTYRHMAEASQKYRLAPSGQAMVEALRPRPLLQEEMSFALMAAIADRKRPLDPDIETPVQEIPSAPIWIEFEAPIATNAGAMGAMFFTCADREIEYQLSLPLTRPVREILLQSVRTPGDEYRWSLHFIDMDGTPVSHYQYYEQAQRWEIIPGAEPCPTEECETIETEDAEGFTHYHIKPCPFCNVLLAHWRSWFVTSLLTVSGEFASTETVDWPIITEETTRKVPRPHSAKYDQIAVKHDYYFVSFDASVKKQYRMPDETPAGERQTRGSWVDAAREIDPESVIYVRQGFGQTERVLDPARNPRWKEKKTVPVRPHKRRVPIKVETLQRRITHVVASKFAQVSTKDLS
jgi:hypothetical protein